MKRQQQQEPADPFDPSVPMDTDLLFQDPLKHKDSEHEQEWKFRQVIDSPRDISLQMLDCETAMQNVVSQPLIKAFTLMFKKLVHQHYIIFNQN